MRLRRLFFILSVLLSITVTLITANSLINAWAQFSKSHAGMRTMQQLQALFIVYEMASRERGPANGVLGDDFPIDPDKRELLINARLATDQALDTFLNMLDSTDSIASETTRQAQRQLILAREAVDLEAGKQRNKRNPDQIRDAVNQMISVIDTLSSALFNLTTDVSSIFPSTTDALLAAVQAAALREYAGQLGSQLTAALATKQRLQADELATINRLRGRIEQLREQLKARAIALHKRETVQLALDIMNERYFDSAMPFVEEQLAIGQNDGNYQVDTAQFAARYVPDMNSIISLRDVLSNDAHNAAKQKLDEVNAIATKSAVGSALLFFLLGLTWWLLHRRVVQPLITTTELIVTIANGHLNLQIPVSKYRDEVADMLGAISVLRDNSIAKRDAEATIRQMAFYDPLTKLPNRRLLEDRLQQAIINTKRHNTCGAMLFIDLDKFKQVNDQQGHEAGDWLLKQVAVRMNEILRESDTAARFGGDEFIVLLPELSSAEDSVLVAEKIRRQMELPFVMDDYTELNISSSIGVVIFPLHADNMKEILRLGDQAMYQVKREGRNGVMVFEPD